MLDVVSRFVQEANGDSEKLAELILQYAEAANRDSRFRYEYTALEFCDVIEIEKLDELGQVGWDIVQILSNRRSAVSRKVYLEDVIMYTVIMKRQYHYDQPESQDE
jgi:hypothetical protein